MTIFSDLKTFDIKFGIPEAKEPQLLNIGSMEGRLDFLKEELKETEDAYIEGDLPEVIDGLLDLIYVAAGTLAQMGVNSQKHWTEVHQCNMAKRRIIGSSSRGLLYDLEKPEDWVPPNHQRILDL